MVSLTPVNFASFRHNTPSFTRFVYDLNNGCQVIVIEFYIQVASTLSPLKLGLKRVGRYWQNRAVGFIFHNFKHYQPFNKVI
jgi:hypothetical protein